MLEAKPAWTFVREQRFLALRTGVLAATASVGASFGRGLLPRSTSDQAIVTGASAAYWLGFSSLGLSAAEAVSEIIVKRRQAGRPEDVALAASVLVALAGTAVIVVVPDSHDVPMPLAVGQSAAWIITGGAIASALVIGSDKVLDAGVGPRSLPLNLGVAVGIGTAASLGRVALRNRRARKYGESGWAQRRPVAVGKNPKAIARAAGTGAAVGAGLVVLAAAQFGIAEGTTTLVSKALDRSQDPVTPLVGHAVAAGLLAAAGTAAVDYTRRRIMKADSVPEPAYPDPPTNPHVTAGPNSVVAFESVGKEGRRFVLMALTAAEITAVMQEPAKEPVRAIAGFASAKLAEERAKIALAEMERLGAFDRSLIVVAAPTGVGYVNYSFAEAVEYLTRGDCAIVVPQYALVPSALALKETRAGEQQQRLILEAIRDRIAAMPPGLRPRVVQFGESLGAEVALDVAASGTRRFAQLGLDAGLYLGTPFRTALWERWFADPASVDPDGVLGMVAQADEIGSLPASVSHVQVIHHDDPVNKFDIASIVRAPWWLGPPQTRPVGVPRETVFRPVISFLISLIDLKNGMNSKPGEFVRQGHDYRIELREAVQRTYGLSASAEQSERIERALREREQEWATRRMVASRFASAQASVRKQLKRWGVSGDELELEDAIAGALARGDVKRRSDSA
jgi:hypothetical protein